MKDLRLFEKVKVANLSRIFGGATWYECDTQSQEGNWQTGIKFDTRYDKYGDNHNFISTRTVYQNP